MWGIWNRYHSITLQRCISWGFRHDILLCVVQLTNSQIYFFQTKEINWRLTLCIQWGFVEVISCVLHECCWSEVVNVGKLITASFKRLQINDKISAKAFDMYSFHSIWQISSKFILQSCCLYCHFFTLCHMRFLAVSLFIVYSHVTFWVLNIWNLLGEPPRTPPNYFKYPVNNENVITSLYIFLCLFS